MTADLTIPLRISSLNAREHWATRARRVRRERAIVRLAWMSTEAGALREVFYHAIIHKSPLRVTLTRVGKRVMDSDNLIGGLKGPRDELASLIGVDDLDGTDGVTWHYDQRVGAAYGLVVQLDTME
jgi:hypothetical protein